MSDVTVQDRAPAKIEIARVKMTQMVPQFAKALPAHIPAERFARVGMTAIQNNPKILTCTEQSVWNSFMQAAQDGLLPDGREGAIVVYGKKDSGNEAKWMPMIGGIRKKVRNSGEIKDWYVEVVYAGDEFQYQKGDDPHLHHKPVPPSQRLTTEGVPAAQRLLVALEAVTKQPIDKAVENDAVAGPLAGVKLTVGDLRRIQMAATPAPMPYQSIIAAYSIAVFKDGSKSVPELMWIEEIEDVRRQSSKAKSDDSPWQIAAFYPEMVKKTVARRHAKTLPLSSDLDDLIRRDDDLYDFNGARETANAHHGTPAQTLAGRLDKLAGVTNHAPAEPANDPPPAEEQAAPPATGDEPPPADETAPSLGDEKPLVTKEDYLASIEKIESKLGCLKWLEQHGSGAKKLPRKDYLEVEKAFADKQKDAPA